MKPVLKQAEPGRFSRERIALRQEMKSRLALLPAEGFLEAGIRAAAIIRSSLLWDQYKTILLFMSMKTEINTLPLLEAGIGDNKKVFVPRVEEGNPGKIRFYRVGAQNQALSTAHGPWNQNSFGISEPFPHDPLEAGDFPALVFTPGLAFDMTGNRLGRGKGFYDRFFAELKGREFTAAGLCMGVQVVPAIPAEPWDYKMNCLYTEQDFNGKLIF